MKQILKYFLHLTLLLTTGLYAATNTVSPYFSIRSQSFDAARELVGMANDFHIKIYDICDFYGTAYVVPEFSRSFRNDRITNCLFGDDLVGCSCPVLYIQGSSVEDRHEKAWLADYFGLPTDYQSQFSFSPRVSNISFDFSLFLGLDNWVSGLYFKLHAPFVHTRWQLNACETDITQGELAYAAGYFDDTVNTTNRALSNIPRSRLLANATEFFIDGKSPDLGTTVQFQPLRYSRWYQCDTLTHDRLAEITASLGWNFFLEDDYHLGIEIRAAAPTGTRPSGCYLFEPVVGNGHHWELGAGLSGHVILWRNDDEENNFGFYADAYMTHLFKTKQHRSFDLKAAKGNSRYMLAAKMTSQVANLIGVSGGGNPAVDTTTIPIAQFDNIVSPVANLTHCDVQVSSSIQASIVALFNYTHGCFGWDFGYNLWARGCEKIEFDCDCPCTLKSEENTWVLKGDAHVYGFGANNATISANSPIALSASNSTATIRSGTNKIVTDVNNERVRNSAIDNPQFAAINTANANNRIMYRSDLAAATANSQTRTSIQPVFLSMTDIDLDAARTKGLSHSLFTHFQYTWKDRDGWIPFLGVGAKVEFASGHHNDCDDSSCNASCDNSHECSSSSCDSGSSCESCHRCSLSQWSVWLKGGISFN